MYMINMKYTQYYSNIGQWRTKVTGEDPGFPHRGEQGDRAGGGCRRGGLALSYDVAIFSKSK